jgi:hypothetical protein
MQGFLPRFASVQFVSFKYCGVHNTYFPDYQARAVEKKILNQLGRPNTSSFVTYAYCAGLHLDNDESVTHGWVIKRGIKVSLNAFPYFCVILISIGATPGVKFCVGELSSDP